MKKCSTVRLSKLSDDQYLEPYREHLQARALRTETAAARISGGSKSLKQTAANHLHLGLHREADGWVFREWAPAATDVYLIGDFSNWHELPRLRLHKDETSGIWELRLPPDALQHGEHYKLRINWQDGSGERIPVYARRVVQDPDTNIFSAQVWNPPEPYRWRCPRPSSPPPDVPLIYEAHVGIAQDKLGIGTYSEFTSLTLPRIAKAGYNIVQLMAIAEHPYYASFGYQVSNFFAASSRFGTPEELKNLIDTAHELGLQVIIDLVHSHAVSNEQEGLSRFDGTPYQYFHDGHRGHHSAWETRCFDYAKPEVLKFLLSNCRFWLEEYNLDGFRFDGVTSMLYLHHGLGVDFLDYAQYFDDSIDEDALIYLALANRLIHEINPAAITVAEDVSGMPGLGAPAKEGGCGFDYRMAMGVPELWFRLADKKADEDWSMSEVWHELTNRRRDERTISYVECHDQAIVGGKTMVFTLMDAAMYTHMQVSDSNLAVDRGMALHKMIRIATVFTAGHGYLNFIGNEFGHPEWIDFPRAGNNWSYHYARRQWHLRQDPNLKYRFLAEFDQALMELAGADKAMAGTAPLLLSARDDHKILAFARAGLFFIFNFNPGQSFTDYPLEMPPGRYDLILNSDEPRFGGHDLIAPGQQFFTVPHKDSGSIRHLARFYLPARTALVLRKLSGTKNK